MVEETLARIARGLVDLGVQQLVVAGGETSGACVQALGVERLRIGGQIDTGVPWCYAIEPPRSLASRSSLPPEGAGLAWGGPAQRPMPPRSLASLPPIALRYRRVTPEGAGFAWGGPAQRPGHAPSLGLHLALKSGNFGGDDFFTKAFDVLAKSS